MRSIFDVLTPIDYQVKFSYPFIFIILFSSFLTLTACGNKEKKPAASAAKGGANQRPPARVDVYVAETSPISETIEVPGSLVAEESTEIHPEVSNRITNLYIREGAYVGK